MGWNPQAGGSEYQLNGDPMEKDPALLKRLEACGTETEINSILTHEAIGYVRAHPLRWLYQRLYSFLFFWHEHTFWAPHSPFRTRKARILGWLNLLFVLLFFVSVPTAWKDGGFLRTVLMFLFFNCLIYTMTHADIGNRFRVQIDPLMLMIVGNYLRYE